MNLKAHFLFNDLNFFPKNVGDVSKEQGGRFLQDIKEMEKRYQGRWNVNMMVLTTSHFTENNKVNHIGEKAIEETLHRKGKYKKIST